MNSRCRPPHTFVICMAAQMNSLYIIYTYRRTRYDVMFVLHSHLFIFEMFAEIYNTGQE
jgi:hypothetical protein